MSAQETTTELTKLLNESKLKRKGMLEKKDYNAAKELRESTFKSAAEHKVKVEESIREKQEVERRRLAVAKNIAIRKIHDAVTEEVTHQDNLNETLHEELVMKQQERLEQYRDRVRSRENQKPVVMSSYVRDLQRSEQQLASFHMYDECAQVRRKIKDQEVHEHKRLAHEKNNRIDIAVEMKKKQFEDDEGFMKAKAKNVHQIAMFKAQQEEERVRRQFEHIERDMEHAHTREIQSNPLLKAYERPKFLRHRSKEGATSATNRGTTYVLRMQGSRYDIPSLCDLYGDELDAGSAQRYSASAHQQDHWHKSFVKTSSSAAGGSKRASSSRQGKSLSATLPAVKPRTPANNSRGRTRVS